ncbi:hypothetical protein BH24ACT12_BH24ACT12_20420 [soil metagenome]
MSWAKRMRVPEFHRLARESHASARGTMLSMSRLSCPNRLLRVTKARIG